MLCRRSCVLCKSARPQICIRLPCIRNTSPNASRYSNPNENWIYPPGNSFHADDCPTQSTWSLHWQHGPSSRWRWILIYCFFPLLNAKYFLYFAFFLFIQQQKNRFCFILIILYRFPPAVRFACCAHGESGYFSISRLKTLNASSRLPAVNKDEPAE